MGIIIFIPSYIFEKMEMVLYGFVEKKEDAVIFYVLGSACSRNCKFLKHYDIIGLTSAEFRISINRNFLSKYWFYVRISNGSLSLQKMYMNDKFISPSRLPNVSVLLYPYEEFLISKIFRDCEFIYNDLKYLVEMLQRKPIVSCCNGRNNRISFNCNLLRIICFYISSILSFVLKLSSGTKLKSIVNKTTIGFHLFNVIENTRFVINDILKNDYVSIKCANYICARIIDCLIGEFLIYLLMYCTSEENLFLLFTETKQNIVKSMHDIVTWLMKDPAGMKLNDEFSLILGLFFHFHISLWRTFLIVMKPVFRIIFKICLFFGYFGVSFQAAMLNDYLTLMAIHIYCFYVYASRLYYYQLISLGKVIRLLVGSEDEIERRVSSSSNSRFLFKIEHLFFYTISFTTLLFLLPTTAVYYGIFAALRLMVIFIGGVLKRIRYLFDVFPLYIFWLLYCDTRTLNSAINIIIEHKFYIENTSIILLKPAYSSHLRTISLCILDGVVRPSSVEWSKIIVNLLLGKLVYQI